MKRFEKSLMVSLQFAVLGCFICGCNAKDGVESVKADRKPSDTSLFSQPDTTAKTFIEAIIESNESRISACIAEQCDPSIADLKGQRADEERLKELAGLFNSAEIVATTTVNNDAYVDYQVDETRYLIVLSRTHDGWKIVNFAVP